MAERGRTYDIITGTSVGAINASFLAQFPVGSEITAANALYSMWSDIRASDVYRKWYHGVLWFLPALWKGSVYTSAPLRSFLGKILDFKRIRESGHLLKISAVSDSTGATGVWRETDADLLDGILASSAFPGVLEAVKARNDLWLDGGTRENTPLADAIALGATDIDVICCTPPGLDYLKETGPLRLFKRVLRAVETLLDECERADLDAAEKWNALVRAGLAPGKREVRIRVFRPQNTIGKSPFDFSPKTVDQLLHLGYLDAVKAMGPQR